MKYRLKYAVPFIGCAGSTIETDSQGWFRLVPTYEQPFQPKYYEDLFEEIKPKRVLVVEYEIIPNIEGSQTMFFEASKVTEIGGEWMKKNHKRARIEERY